MPKVILGTRNTSGVPEFAGSTWVRLQYMLGLLRLGVDAYWVDRLSAIDALQPSHSLGYLMRRFDRTAWDFGFGDRYCVVYNGGERYFGLSERELLSLVRQTDLFINISGHLPSDSPLIKIARRAHVDVDPGFTQIWAQQVDMGLQHHDYFFTTGLNVGGPQFTIPTQGREWIPIVPPVALDAWPVMFDQRFERISTVADWRGSQNAVFDGEEYSGKRDEFLRVLRLPLETAQRFELALCIGAHDYEDLGLLCEHGWGVIDPYWFAGDPYSYREFIQFSRAEFSVAKGGYVRSRSGWVSDRTACYLASGKPALVQSTGFEEYLPVGRGLLTFRTLEEAVAGIQEINRDYSGHCQAARALAERYFDSDRVLGFILERVGL
jgi:hypothetical protein